MERIAKELGVSAKRTETIKRKLEKVALFKPKRGERADNQRTTWVLGDRFVLQVRGESPPAQN